MSFFNHEVQMGPFKLESPFVLAPMAGITNSPFRRLMREMGSSMVISELVSANGIEYASARTLDLLRFHPSERPVGLQIFGEDEENLVKATKKIEEMGADFADLNLGCPVPKIVKKGGGAAMCRDPVTLGKILSAMVKSVKIPVTIKIRTGWDAETKNAHEIVKVAEESGVRWVAVHGRTRAQGYSGLADWDFIGEIKAKAKIPIAGNGDLNTAEEAFKKYRTYGVDAVWLGRGALRNPFLFKECLALWRGEELKTPGVEDFLEILRRQQEYMMDSFKNPKAVMLHARKFLAWYASGFTGCKDFRREVFTEPEPEKLWALARSFFESSQSQKTKGYLSEPFLMGGHG